MVFIPNTGALDFGMTQERSRTDSKVSALSSSLLHSLSPERSSLVSRRLSLRTPQKRFPEPSSRSSGVSPCMFCIARPLHVMPLTRLASILLVFSSLVSSSRQQTNVFWVPTLSSTSPPRLSSSLPKMLASSAMTAS